MNKPIQERISYYTRKVAERSSLHPSKPLPRAYRYRNERLLSYNHLMHQIIERYPQERKDAAIKGRLTVFFGVDTVSLLHQVNGRISCMDLDENDCITLISDSEGKTISVNDVLHSIVSDKSEGHTDFHRGQSVYEGSKVKVLLSDSGSRAIESNMRKLMVNDIFSAVEAGFISLEVARETLVKWESDFDF